MKTEKIKGEDHYQCRKIKAERDQLRAELEKERERVKELAEIAGKIKGMVSMVAFEMMGKHTYTHNPDEMQDHVLELLNSALSAGEGDSE